eukprot:2183441-Pleurochrysis_carterae.AAC.7
MSALGESRFQITKGPDGVISMLVYLPPPAIETGQAEKQKNDVLEARRKWLIRQKAGVPPSVVNGTAAF